MTEKSCKDRVRANLTGRINDLKKLWCEYCDGEEDVLDLGSIHEYGLAFDYVVGEAGDRGYFRYQISTGGPGDEFRFFCGPDFVLDKVEYWFLDWFDGAKITLSGTRFSLMAELFEWFREMGDVDRELQKALG